ncbi:MAG: prepilin-type N-terminal cleavage/methylation domain-containing protein [Planctomycetota bacterium]|nr:prepilin-type N-terminal cleavage/methylation domain-containing protein [Planctomycetota bacterium]
MKQFPVRQTPAMPRGFTLIEAAISIAIVGVLIAASAGTFGAIARGQRVQLERWQGYLLAQQLMAEIEQTYFTDPASSPPSGSAGGGPRTSYNGVSDYNGFVESPPTLRDGTILTDYTGWTRSVVVVSVDPSAPAKPLSNSTLKKIAVTITSPSGKQYSLIGLRSQLGNYETQTNQQINYVTGVSISLKPTTGNSLNTTAHPLNVATNQ